MDKDALGAIIVTALLVLSISSPIVSAVSINYEADSGGDSVYINENYDIDNTVTVTETTDLYFGNLQVDQERTAEGTGKTDLEQTITGKPMEGAGYVAENDIKSDGTIDAQTSTSATANTLSVDQEVSATGDTNLHVEGEKADNKAGHDAGVNSGTLQSKQTLRIDNSVRTSLDASIKGTFGRARSWAEDADENKASTFVWVNRGKISTTQEAEADGSATASKDLIASGHGIYMGCRASNAEGDHASMDASVGLGAIAAFDAAKAIKKKATTSDNLTAIGLGIQKSNYASNAEGDYAGTYASVDAGILVSSENAEAIIDKATASEVLVATGSGIGKGSQAWNAEGDYASTEASVDSGLIVSYDEAEAIIDKATASEVFTANGSGIRKGSQAWNAEGDYASTSASVDSGLIVSYDNAEAVIDKVTASEVFTANGSGIRKGSQTWNAEGDYASTSASVASGLVVSYDEAEAIKEKATASEVLAATGSGIEKGSEAWNAEGDYAGTGASVARGLVVSYDNAEAIKEKATASEVLAATGSGIEKGSEAWNAEGDYAGTGASVARGLVVSYDEAEAIKEKATASEVLAAAGSGIEKGSEAWNAEGDYAVTGASVASGLVVSYDEAEAIKEKATASEVLAATGFGIEKGSETWNAEGDYAVTGASVASGLVVSYDEAEAIKEKATASEVLAAAGFGIEKGSETWNAEGDYASTGASVASGLVVSYDEAEAIKEKATASEVLAAAGFGIEKGSEAWNAEGDYASTGASVASGLVVSYDEAEAIKEKATASEVLAAAGFGIEKGSEAWNAEGDYASTGASVASGLVVSYDEAEAIKEKATASEVLAAAGFGIEKGSEAWNAEGDYASTGASVASGLVVSYDEAEAIKEKATASEVLAAAGFGIDKGSYARNDEGDYASTEASVDIGLVVSYDEAEAIVDKATASELLVATGFGIQKGSYARNDVWDYAGTTALVASGLVVSYDKAEAIVDKAKASEVLAATGSGIRKGSYATNDEGDYAGTGAWVDNGFLVSYDEAEAIIDKAKASEVFTANGSGIRKGSYATNDEGDYASTTASVDSGLVVSYDKAEAIIDKAKASEVFTANGSGIQKGSYARNDVWDYASTTASVDSGLVVSYDEAEAIIDKATVIAGSMISGDVIRTDSYVRNSRGNSSTYASVEDGTLLSVLGAISTTEKMTGAMQMIQAEGELINAGDISHAPNGYARNDVEVTNGDLTAAMGTVQTPLDDITIEEGDMKLKLTEIDIATTGMNMHTDSCDSVKATAEANNIHKSGTAYDEDTGSGTVTKSSLALMLHLYYDLRIDMPWPIPDIHEEGYFDEQQAVVP